MGEVTIISLSFFPYKFQFGKELCFTLNDGYHQMQKQVGHAFPTVHEKKQKTKLSRDTSTVLKNFL